MREHHRAELARLRHDSTLAIDKLAELRMARVETVCDSSGTWFHYKTQL